MRQRNYYQILMVDPDADQDIIAVVHRRLAQRWHPDVDPSPEARARMLEVNEAWDTLRDPERRRRYDAQLAMRRDRRSSDRFIKRPTTPIDPETLSGRSPYGEAGPPPAGPRKGPVLDFGRYRGWTLEQVARHDRDFLEWLQRHPAGRLYRVELEQLLGHAARP
ncbi:MAG: J domain-containing protein [Chloroflexota bacterium]